MRVYRLIWDRREPFKIRFQAFINLFCIVYLVTASLIVTHTAFFHILPACYSDQPWLVLVHRCSITYLLICTVSQFVTCVLTDSGVQSERKEPFYPKLLRTKSGKEVKKEFLKSVNGDTKIIMDRSNNHGSLESMHFCKLCNLIVPARTHHCLLCKKCVKKRDHHCFFMGVCIGKSNHVYFIFFTLYMGIGTFYGMLLLAKYLYFFYGIRFYGPQSFVGLFFNTMMMLLKGTLPTARFLFTFILLYLSLFGTVFAFGFFSWHMLIVSRGQTTYEARHGIKKFSDGSARQNFKGTFRAGVVVSLLVPFCDILWRKKRAKGV